MSQAKLVDFAGRLSELAEDHRRILDAVNRSQQVAAYYQEDASKWRAAVALLKGELIRQHQAQLYRSNEGKFAVLRRQVYEHFRDVVFQNWDPAQAPDGIYYHDAFLLAQKETWGARMNEATYRRRWNELADKRVTNPPLLEWEKPGYYVFAQLEGSTQ
jgi:hypothetical protein